MKFRERGLTLLMKAVFEYSNRLLCSYLIFEIVEYSLDNKILYYRDIFFKNIDLPI